MKFNVKYILFLMLFSFGLFSYLVDYGFSLDGSDFNGRAVMIVNVDWSFGWRDYVVFSAIPAMYSWCGKPNVIVYMGSDGLYSNVELFLDQYCPDRVFVVGDYSFDINFTGVLDSSVIEWIRGGCLDELCIAISQRFFDNCDLAVLVNVNNYSLALISSLYASYMHVPLFYFNNSVSSIVLNELERLGVNTIVLIDASPDIADLLDDNYNLIMINSVDDLISMIIDLLGIFDYVVITNPLDHFNYDRMSLAAPLLAIYHRGIVIPIEFNMSEIKIYRDYLNVCSGKPIGVPDVVPLRFVDLYADDIPPERDVNSTWTSYPVNGSYWTCRLSCYNPFDVAGLLFVDVCFGSYIENSSCINAVLIDFNRNNLFSDDEFFKITNNTLIIPGLWIGDQLFPPLGNYTFTNITFVNISSISSIGGLRLICKAHTWLEGRVDLMGNKIKFVLSLNMTREGYLWDNAYGSAATNYVLINFDFNGNGRFDDDGEGPYTFGDVFVFNGHEYLIDYDFIGYCQIPCAVKFISPNPKRFYNNLLNLVNNYDVKYICLCGSPETIPFQPVDIGFENRYLLWSDYDYSFAFNHSYSVGRIDAYNVIDASLLCLRTINYDDIISFFNDRRALILCSHYPPYSIVELKLHGFNVTLMGHHNYTIESVWEAMCNSDVVLISVGHAYWPFEYAEPIFYRPAFVIHWMCSSIYENVGYKRFIRDGVTVFIGTTEIQVAPEGGDVEFIHTLLHLMLNYNYTIGEAFNIAREYLSIRTLERCDDIGGRGYRFLAMKSSCLFGDPKFRFSYVPRKVPISINRFNNVPIRLINSMHYEAYFNLNITIYGSTWWEQYVGVWCGGRTSEVYFFRVEGLTVSQVEQDVPLGLDEYGVAGVADIFYPTFLMIYKLPNGIIPIDVKLITRGNETNLNESIIYSILSLGDDNYLIYHCDVADYNKENRTLYWFIRNLTFKVTYISSLPVGNIVYVPDNYSSIQDAINHAFPGDIIYVRSGFYNESVIVNKSSLKIIGLKVNGEMPILNSFLVNANNTLIDGFKINGSAIAIKILSNNNTIRNCIIDDCSGGIYLSNSNDNLIINCSFTNNFYYAIELYYSNNNTIDNCIFINNKFGLYIKYSDNNSIANCIFSNNWAYGVDISYANNYLIFNNTFINNPYGLGLHYLNNCVIWFNSFINSSNSHTICYELYNCYWHSPEIVWYYYNNCLFSGYLGNYWDNYAGSDINGDGIGDQSYTIYGIYTDDHPLIKSKDNYKVITPIRIEIPLYSGWNLISIPLYLTNNAVSEVFNNYMDKILAIYTWSPVKKMYVEVNEISFEKGYWILALETFNLTLSGIPVKSFSLDVEKGWNLIGSTFNQSMIINTTNILPTYFIWNSHKRMYISVKIINPFRGHWILAYERVKIIIE